MTTALYLRQIDRLEKQIQNTLLEIQKLKSMACSAAWPNDAGKVQTSPKKDKIGMFVARIVQAEKECDELADRRADIVRQIESIEDAKMYDVLAKTYILVKTEKEIAFDIQKTPRQVSNILKKAHEIFEEKYGYLYLDR